MRLLWLVPPLLFVPFAGCDGAVAGITGSTTTSGGECERLRDDLEELLFKLLDTHELLQECVSQTDDPDSCAEYFDAWVLLTIAHAEAYAAWSGCGDGPL